MSKKRATIDSEDAEGGKSTIFGTTIGYDEQGKPRLTEAERMAGYIFTRVKGVLDVAKRTDAPTMGLSYQRDRALCEARIKTATEALAKAGEHGEEESRKYDLGWAHHELEEALLDLARVVARHKLAERWVELGYGGMEGK